MECVIQMQIGTHIPTRDGDIQCRINLFQRINILCARLFCRSERKFRLKRLTGKDQFFDTIRIRSRHGHTAIPLKFQRPLGRQTANRLPNRGHSCAKRLNKPLNRHRLPRSQFSKKNTRAQVFIYLLMNGNTLWNIITIGLNLPLASGACHLCKSP